MNLGTQNFETLKRIKTGEQNISKNNSFSEQK